MKLIEWSRLIAPLLFDLYLSAMSKLLSASFKSISTPEGAYIQSTRKYLEKSLKILPIPFYIQKILIDRVLLPAARNQGGNLNEENGGNFA